MEILLLENILASEQDTVNRTLGHTRQICKKTNAYKS